MSRDSGCIKNCRFTDRQTDRQEKQIDRGGVRFVSEVKRLDEGETRRNINSLLMVDSHKEMFVGL